MSTMSPLHLASASREQLVQRIMDLEAQLPQASTSQARESVTVTSAGPDGQKRVRRPPHEVGTALPPSLAKMPKRHIALLFAYQGWAHSGLAYQAPNARGEEVNTVELAMLKGLMKGRLIEPIVQEIEGFGCGFERCGRTDAGVSSSAQVVNLWVRSNLKDPMGTGKQKEDGTEAEDETPEKPEINYVSVLNRLLPPSVRILAWSPVSANFSSRFSCVWRQYKYFFSVSPTSPLVKLGVSNGSAYPITPEEEAWKARLEQTDWPGLELDIDLMRNAAQRLVGEHDFRNFCKVDAPKQLKTHRRNVISATIDAVEGEEPDLYVLNLRGGAFLYNQVRHIMALLMLVGARLEPPETVDRLLWTSDRPPSEKIEGKDDWDVLDGKPGYEIADDLPLVLWECGYNSNEFQWRIGASKEGLAAAGDDTDTSFKWTYGFLHQTWTEHRLKAVILRHHLTALSRFTPSPTTALAMTHVPLGGGSFLRTGNYVPLLTRPRADTPEVANAKWAEGRGAEKMKKRALNASSEETQAKREANMAVKQEAYEAYRREQAEKASP